MECAPELCSVDYQQIPLPKAILTSWNLLFANVDNIAVILEKLGTVCSEYNQVLLLFVEEKMGKA